MRQIKEGDVVRQILDYLQAERIFAFRVNTATILASHHGKQRMFKSHSLGPGAADIIALLNAGSGLSRVLFLEVKNEKGKLSSVQRSFGEYVMARNCFYAVVRSAAETADAIRSIENRDIDSEQSHSGQMLDLARDSS
jgi:hypothetical protein